MFWDNEGELPRDDARLTAPVAAVARAVDDIRDQIENGDISEEEPVAQRLAQAVRAEIRGVEDEGVRWNARVITPRKATERHHGTDLAIWMDIDLADDGRGPGYTARKTVLVQTKRADRLSAEMPHLREQARNMKRLSSASAVIVVGAGESEMWAADASAVSAQGSAGSLRGAGRPIPELFAAAFRCQVGDRRWDTARQVRDALEAQAYLLIDGHQRFRRRKRGAFT